MMVRPLTNVNTFASRNVRFGKQANDTDIKVMEGIIRLFKSEPENDLTVQNAQVEKWSTLPLIGQLLNDIAIVRFTLKASKHNYHYSYLLFRNVPNTLREASLITLRFKPPVNGKVIAVADVNAKTLLVKYKPKMIAFKR